MTKPVDRLTSTWCTLIAWISSMWWELFKIMYQHFNVTLKVVNLTLQNSSLNLSVKFYEFCKGFLTFKLDLLQFQIYIYSLYLNIYWPNKFWNYLTYIKLNKKKNLKFGVSVQFLKLLQYPGFTISFLFEDFFFLVCETWLATCWSTFLTKLMR